MAVKVRLMNRSDDDYRKVDTFNYDVSLLGSSVSAAQARADAAYDLAKSGGGGGTDLSPVSPIYIQDGKIGCRTASDFNGDNSRPMTASGVKTIVGDIESLLKEI